MSKNLSTRAFLVFFIVFILKTLAYAQAGTTKELVIDVRANDIEELPNTSLLIFESEELQKRSSQSLGDFLKMQPGFQVTTNYLGIASATLRGMGAGNILVYWNGLRLNDPLDPTTSFDFSRVRLESLQKIEIIRGPEAAIWGSGATGAVVFVTSEAQGARDGLSGEVDASAGTYDTYALAAKLNSKTQYSDSLFSANIKTSGGISSASESLGNTERDSRTDQNGFFYNSYKLKERWILNSLLTLANSKNDADLRGGVGGDDLGAKDSETTVGASLQLQYRPRQSLQNTMSVNYQNDSRFHENSVEYARYKSQYFSLSDEVQWKINNRNRIQVAIESDFEKAKSNESTGFIEADRHALALRTGYETNFFPLIFKTGFRFEKDIDSSRNPAWSLFVSPSYTFVATGTNISLAAGHAFKRASLYQLYSIYGNSGLDSEEMWSYEANVLQELDFINSQYLLSYFWNHAQQSIDFDFPTMKYFNGGEKENYGIENVFETKWASFLKSRLEYTWTHTSALRIAEHKASAQLNWTLGSKLSLMNELRYVGERKDIDPTVYTGKNKSAYILVNAQLSYQILRSLRASFRVDNLLDKEYEEIDGFGSPGRYAELSLKYTF